MCARKDECVQILTVLFCKKKIVHYQVLFFPSNIAVILLHINDCSSYREFLYHIQNEKVYGAPCDSVRGRCLNARHRNCHR